MAGWGEGGGEVVDLNELVGMRKRDRVAKEFWGGRPIMEEITSS